MPSPFVRMQNSTNGNSNKQKNNKNKNKKVKIPALNKALTDAKNINSSGGQIRSLNSTKNSYYNALIDPFNISANGIRVPDLYSAPTATLKLTKRFTVTPNTSGNANVVFLPCAFINALADVGSISTATQWYDWTGNVVGTANSSLSTTPSVIATKLTNYRLVSWGIRVIDTASMTNVSGTVIVAKVATKKGFVPVKSAIGFALANNANDHVENFYKTYGFPYTGSGSSAQIDTSSLTALPEHNVFSALQVAQEGVRIIPKIISPEAFNFQGSADSYYGLDPIPGIATGSIYVGDASYLTFGGWESVVVSILGSGGGTSAPALDIEVVYHLEGQPNITGSSGVSLDGVKNSPVHYQSYFNALDKFADCASFVPALSSATNMYRALRSITA